MTPTEPADRPAEILARLEQTLQRQLQRLASNDLDGLETLLAEARALTARLDGVDLAPARHGERVRRIAELDAKVGLALAQRRQELSESLRHGRRGKAVLGAYRRALS